MRSHIRTSLKESKAETLGLRFQEGLKDSYKDWLAEERESKSIIAGSCLRYPSAILRPKTQGKWPRVTNKLLYPLNLKEVIALSQRMGLVLVTLEDPLWETICACLRWFWINRILRGDSSSKIRSFSEYMVDIGIRVTLWLSIQMDSHLLINLQRGTASSSKH